MAHERNRFPHMAQFWTPGRTDEFLRNMAQRINGVLRGETNNTHDVTLTPNATSTVYSDPRITRDTVVVLMARTASAAAVTGLYRVAEAGKVTIYHDSNPATDREFDLVFVG